MTEEQIRLVITGRNRLGPALRGAKASVREFADGTVGQFRRILNLQNALVAGMAGMAARSVLKPAMDMEMYEQQMRVLLGSADKAKERIAELTQFAATTPFQLPAIIRAARTLEVLTKGAWSGSGALRTLGDAAAASNRPIDELAVWFGRLYDGLKNNQPVGEALQRLQELGLIAGDVRRRIGSLTKANAEFAEKWGAVRQAMAGFAGMTERLAGTAAGKLSTMRDNWEAVRREIGEKVLPDLKRALDEVTVSLQELSASGEVRKWGRQTAAVLRDIYTMVSGLARFISENAPMLKLMGFSWAGYKLLKSLHGGAVLLESAVRSLAGAQLQAAAANTAVAGSARAAATANTAVAGSAGLAAGAVEAETASVLTLSTAFGTLKGALGSIAAIGATWYAGWNLGKLIADVTGLGDRIERIAFDIFKNSSPEGSKSELEAWNQRWKKKYGSLKAVNKKGLNAAEAFAELRREQETGEKRRESRRTGSADRPGPPPAPGADEAAQFAEYQAAMRNMAEKVKADLLKGNRETADLWESVTGQTVRHTKDLDASAAGLLEGWDKLRKTGDGEWKIGLEVMGERIRRAHDLKTRIEAAEAAERDAAQALEDAADDRGWDRAIRAKRAALDAARRELEGLRSDAARLADEAQSAWKTAVFGAPEPTDQEKRDARIERNAERRLKRARARIEAERRFSPDLSDEEIGKKLRLSKKTIDLVAADNLRRRAAEAAKRAPAAEAKIADLSDQIAALEKQRGAETQAQRMQDLRDAAKEAADEVAKLRKQLEDLGGARAGAEGTKGTKGTGTPGASTPSTPSTPPTPPVRTPHPEPVTVPVETAEAPPVRTPQPEPVAVPVETAEAPPVRPPKSPEAVRIPVETAETPPVRTPQPEPVAVPVETAEAPAAPPEGERSAGPKPRAESGPREPVAPQPAPRDFAAERESRRLERARARIENERRFRPDATDDEIARNLHLSKRTRELLASPAPRLPALPPMPAAPAAIGGSGRDSAFPDQALRYLETIARKVDKMAGLAAAGGSMG